MSAYAHQPTIMIVDDDKSAVEMLDTLLKSQGYHTKVANSGQEALAVIEQELEKANRWKRWSIDLFLLDIMMPGIDGYKVCLRIKDEPALYHIPVIMVTALDSSRDKSTAVSFGADGYITKPYLSEDLMSTIKALLRIKEQQEVLLRQLVEMDTASATVASAHCSLNLSIIIGSVLTTLLESGHIEGAAIYALDESGKSLVLSGSQSSKGADLPTIPSCSLGQGFIGQIGQSKQGQWINDIASRPEFTGRLVSNMHAYVGVALCVDTRTVGALEVFHHQPGWFDQRDVEWLSKLGHQIGLAIENANLFERTQTMLLGSS